MLLNLSPPIETYFFLRTDCQQLTLLHDEGKCGETIQSSYKVNAARKSKVDDNTAKMQSIKWLGV
ncbi:hypothetical protein DXC44_05905 [Phocaeicola vulgatus]|uniref:Uncharacterized protein n=1 Tax=Phocaeicola vulgatus TaxID=821 RepID=A0A3E4TA05_PHOVU|nr:hypothetical protein DXC44_05905 [Phocaeicola vulgatus]